MSTGEVLREEYLVSLGLNPASHECTKIIMQDDHTFRGDYS